MGDGADFLMEQWDPYIDGWYGDNTPRHYYEKSTLSCRYCGKAGLQWMETVEGKWRLADSKGHFHECKEYFR
jgi:hypothetical protein